MAAPPSSSSSRPCSLSPSPLLIQQPNQPRSAAVPRLPPLSTSQPPSLLGRRQTTSLCSSRPHPSTSSRSSCHPPVTPATVTSRQAEPRTAGRAALSSSSLRRPRPVPSLWRSPTSLRLLRRTRTRPSLFPCRECSLSPSCKRWVMTA